MKKVCAMMLATMCVTPILGAGYSIPGDLNDDGKVNNLDLALLQRLLNGWL